MEFSLNVFGPEKAVIEPIGEGDRDLCLELFKKAFVQRCLQNNSWTAFGRVGSEFQHIKYTFVHGSDGYGYCAIINKDRHIDVKATIEIEGSNVNFSNPFVM